MNVYFKKVMTIQDEVLQIVRDGGSDLITKELKLREYFGRIALDKFVFSESKNFPDRFSNDQLKRVLIGFGMICTPDTLVTSDGINCYTLTRKQVQEVCFKEGIREVDLKRAFAKRKWLVHDNRKYTRFVINPKTGRQENLYLLKFEALCHFD